MSKQKIYINASPDELEYEREFAFTILTNLNFDPLFSYDSNAQSMDGTSNMIDKSDVVVFILWREFQTTMKQEYAEAVQKGKPIVLLVKLLKEGEVRDPDLTKHLEEIKTQGKLGVAPFSVTRQFRYYRSLSDFEKQMIAGITDEIDKKRSMDIQTTKTREGMYQLGTSITLAAQDRLLIAQQTPSILVGPRQYKAPPDEKIAYEADFHDTVWEWIERCVVDKSRQCIVLYDLQAMITEVQENGLQMETKKRLSSLKEFERKSGYRFKIIGTREKYSGPLAIGDNWLAIWLMGKYNAFAISFINKSVADLLSDVFYQLASTPKSISESMSELEI